MIDNIVVPEIIVEKLLNPDNQLLIRFKDIAPGTFKHCEAVASLCEKCARALKLNVDVCKIIGIYHDIGKIWAPEYFCENQPLDYNVHTTLDPFISKYIISSHVANTTTILVTECPDMPVDLIRIMAMHHGNSVSSIYSKIRDSDEISAYTEDNFRYPYNKSDNIYSGVLMACDVMEAKLKSLKQADKLKDEDVPAMICSTMKELLYDQLDDLKHREGKVITEVLKAELGFVGKRVIDGYENNIKGKK